MDPQATCGRVVHYTVARGVKRCALVIADTPADGTAALMVQLDSGPAPLFSVPYSNIEGVVGHWNWMPYQKEKAKTERGNVSESAVDPDEPEADPPVAGVPADGGGDEAGGGDPGEIPAIAAGVPPGDEAPVVDSEAPKVTPGPGPTGVVATDDVEAANPPDET